jgi:hypothetical protein
LVTVPPRPYFAREQVEAANVGLRGFLSDEVIRVFIFATHSDK